MALPPLLYIVLDSRSEGWYNEGMTLDPVQADKDLTVLMHQVLESTATRSDTMNLKDIKEELTGKRRRRADPKAPAILYMIEAHPNDVALQFHSMCVEILGREPDYKSVPSLLGDTKPMAITVVLKDGTKVPIIQVGLIELPLGGIVFGRHDQGALLELLATTDAHPQRSVDAFYALCEEIQKRARERSIYRGEMVDSSWNFLGWSDPPLVLPQEKAREVEANLLYPIRNREVWRELGSKRSVMVIGDYGTGKTTIAKKVALMSTKHGWTFMSIRTFHMGQLPHLLHTLRLFKPCVVFLEDIDSVTMEDDEMGRGIYVNMILNMLDGVEGDTSDMMFLLTSNFAERITPALKRPGRTDCIITLERPDVATAMEAFRLFEGGNCRVTEALPPSLDKMSYAEIREVVRRGRLLAHSEDRCVMEGDYVEAAEQLHKVKKIMEEGVRFHKVGFHSEREV